MFIRDQGRWMSLATVLSVAVVPAQSCEQAPPPPPVEDPVEVGTMPEPDPTDPTPVDPTPVDPTPVEPAPTETVDPCAPTAAITGPWDCLAYGRCKGTPLEGTSLGCAFAVANGMASCECRSAEHSVRCEQTENGVSCAYE
ncbi:MAG: hypothetical protein QM820_18420 [Minicystis sp.]